MKKFFLLFALMLSPALAMASGGGACGDLHECEKAPVDLHNKASLQNGAKVFISYCLGCHSAKYLRYERMAQDLEIDPKLVEEYMMFTTDKIGDGIDTKVNHKDQAKWFGFIVICLIFIQMISVLGVLITAYLKTWQCLMYWIV